MENQDIYAYLPSKRTGLVALVVVIGFGVYGVSQNYTAISNLFQSEEINKQEVTNQLKQTDSDNDGLSDWQENLWNTNPNDKDTDGDGTIDGQEVKQNRDPTKANEDELSVLEREKIENGSREGVNTNKTDQVFRQILPGAVLQAQQQAGSSTELSQERITQIIQETRSNIDINTEEDRPYNQGDISVTDSTTETRKRYSQYLTANLSTVANNQPGDELLLFAQAAKGQSPEQKYQQMLTIAQLYTDLSEDLLEVPVPETFSDQHIRLINNYHLLALSIEEMVQVDEDPARALSAIQRYRKITRENTNILYRIGQQLNQDLSY